MKRAIQNPVRLIILFVFLGFSCQKIDPVPVTKFCTIPPAINISYTSATVHGKLMDIGEEITAYGHCWSKTPNPTITGFKNEILGTPVKLVEFTSELRALTPSTKYYIRAYTVSKNEIKYSEEISFTTNTVPANQLVDCDNNLYNTVVIGSQTWMKSNLKVTRFKDGMAIPLVTQTSSWSALNTPGYCWYNNDELTNKPTYGALYNWFAVNTGKLCPTGWHVPSDAEWTQLSNFLGGLDVAGGKLKEMGTIHWASPNNGATNETGFTALPGGVRDGNGVFWVLGQYGNWWTSTQFNTTIARSRAIGYPDGRIFSDSIAWFQDGKSIRCLKD